VIPHFACDRDHEAAGAVGDAAPLGQIAAKGAAATSLRLKR